MADVEIEVNLGLNARYKKNQKNPVFTYLGVLAGISVHSAKTWTPAIQGEECRVASCLGGRDRRSHDERLCCLHQSGTSQAHVDNASGELCVSVCTHAQTLGLLLTDLFFFFHRKFGVLSLQEIWGAFQGKASWGWGALATQPAGLLPTWVEMLDNSASHNPPPFPPALG